MAGAQAGNISLFLAVSLQPGNPTRHHRGYRCGLAHSLAHSQAHAYTAQDMCRSYLFSWQWAGPSLGNWASILFDLPGLSVATFRSREFMANS